MDAIIHDLEQVLFNVKGIHTLFDDDKLYLSLLPNELRDIVIKYINYDVQLMYNDISEMKSKLKHEITKDFIYIDLGYSSDPENKYYDDFIIHFKSKTIMNDFIKRYKGFFDEESRIIRCVNTQNDYSQMIMEEVLQYGYSFGSYIFHRKFQNYRAKIDKNDSGKK